MQVENLQRQQTPETATRRRMKRPETDTSTAALREGTHQLEQLGGRSAQLEQVLDAAKPSQGETVTSEDIKLMEQTQALEARIQQLVQEGQAEMRQVALEALRQEVPLLTDENAEAELEAIQRAHPEGFQGLELSLVQFHREKLLIVDAAGKLQEISVTRENASAVLKQIKQMDEQLGRTASSYELRQEILRRSGTKLSSAEAFTYGTFPDKKGLKPFLDKPENWLPERRRVHEAMISSEMEKALKLAERLEDPGVIYAMRGNTASGKTRTLRGNPTFRKAINPETNNPDGAINPDTYKAALQEQARGAAGWQNVSSQGVHNEGAMISRRLMSALETRREASMIIDKRLNESGDIAELVELAKKTGKKLKFLDVDAPLLNSMVGVLERKPGGADPLVPFGAVAEGFEGVRKNRIKLIREVIQNDAIEVYTLYAPGEDGKSILVAEKKQGVFVVHDKLRFAEAIGHVQVNSTIETMKGMLLDDEELEQLIKKAPPGRESHWRAALTPYKGKTLGEALDAHSRLQNGVDYYIKQSLANLDNTSRTKKGKVDTSASPDKAEKMARDLTPEVAAERATTNYTEAMKTLYANRERNFTSAADLRSFVENIAQTVNRGILADGQSVIRQGADSPKYPYTRVADLEQAMSQFYEQLFVRMSDPKEDPVKLAAWAEYHIDMTDHFFADGCGKMAKAISGWILMRASLPLPIYTDRDEYYRHGRKTIRDVSVPEDPKDVELVRFTNYFEKLQRSK